MKKTKLTRSLLAACSIVALSAVMYGCAHTDSGPSQEELDVANAATAAAEAKADVDAAAAATAAEEAAATAATAAEEAAAAAATAAEEAAATAATAAEEAAAAAATAAEEAAAAAATAAEEAAAAAATAAEEAAAAAATAADDAEAARQAAQDEADRLQRAADKAAHDAMVARLMTLHAGLTDDDGNVTETEIGVPAISPTHGMPATSKAESYDVDANGVVSTTDSTLLVPAFAVAEMGMADEIDGFSGTLLMRADDDHIDQMTVYTDIDEPTHVPFGQMHPTSTGQLAIVSGTRSEDIESDNFAKANLVTHAANADDDDPGDVNDHVAFEGTYQGAEGVYRCEGVAACMSSRDSDGVVTLAGADWTFTPNAGAMVKVVDGIYMHFGWWLRENKAPEANTGALSAQVFAGSNGAPITLAATDIGKVTFEGSAAGKYALDDPLAQTVGGGHFTAAASLAADFGDGSDMGTISGEITGGNWSVELLSTVLTAGGATEMNFNTVGETEVATAAAGGAGTKWTIDGVTGSGCRRLDGQLP